MGRVQNSVSFDRDEPIAVEHFPKSEGHNEFATVDSGKTTLFFRDLDHIRQWAALILVRVAELEEKGRAA